MRVNYEEKTYESYFNSELAGASNIYFPLGQRQEGYLGFDAVSYSESEFIWRLLAQSMLNGAPVNDMVTHMEAFVKEEITRLPAFKANLVFQYKKPDYIRIASGKEWKHWKAPYYRYSIYKEQQRLLQEIHNKFSNGILVLYASPALENVDALARAYISKEIILKSNFTKAASLSLHERNTYLSQGIHSVACSEPEIIENVDIISSIEQFQNSDLNDVDNIEFIINFCSQIRSIVVESEEYQEAFSILSNLYQGIQESELIYNLINLRLIREITGIQWLVAY